MSWLSSLFKSPTPNIQSVDPRNPQQQSTDSFLSNFLNTYGSQYDPAANYTGNRVAPMDTYQTQGLGFLQNYLNAPNVSPGLGNIQTYLQNLINNPSGSPQNQAFTQAAQRNNTQAVNTANADFGARGNFFSTAAVNKIGDINAQTAMGINTNLANQQTAAVGPASALEQYISGIPLQKTSAALQYGALPQQLDQANLEAQYQDFLRKQQGLAGVISGAKSSNVATQPYVNTTPSLFQQLTPFLGNMASNAIPGILGMFSGGGGVEGASMGADALTSGLGMTGASAGAGAAGFSMADLLPFLMAA